MYLVHQLYNLTYSRGVLYFSSQFNLSKYHFYHTICIKIARACARGRGAFSDLTSKDTPGRLQEHGRLLERLRYIRTMCLNESTLESMNAEMHKAFRSLTILYIAHNRP